MNRQGRPLKPQATIIVKANTDKPKIRKPKMHKPQLHKSIVLLYSFLATLFLVTIFATKNVYIEISNNSLVNQYSNYDEKHYSNKGESDALDDKSILLPNIQLIGAQKSGTSSLAWTLFKRYGICNYKRLSETDSKKEVHFFDAPEKVEKGLKYYSSMFDHCGKKKRMDATPNYLKPGVARKVREAYDSVGQTEKLKIIVTLREPVSRELSMYNHRKRVYAKEKNETKGRSVLTEDGGIQNFTEFVNTFSLNSIEKGYSYGLYGKHLKEWFELFDRKQILVLSFDELIQDEKSYYTRIIQFLYPRGNKKPKHHGVKRNTHTDDKKKIKMADCSVHTKLATAFANDTENFYTLLESYPGPPMEQRPFPRFQLDDCEEEK